MMDCVAKAAEGQQMTATKLLFQNRHKIWENSRSLSFSPSLSQWAFESDCNCSCISSSQLQDESYELLASRSRQLRHAQCKRDAKQVSRGLAPRVATRRHRFHVSCGMPLGVCVCVDTTLKLKLTARHVRSDFSFDEIQNYQTKLFNQVLRAAS